MARSRAKGTSVPTTAPFVGAASPPALSGRCGQPARPAPWPAPEWAAAPAPGGTPRATSTPVSTRVRTLSSRKKGLPSVRAIKSCLSGPGWGRLPAGPARTRRHWRVAVGRAAVACSRSCSPSCAGTRAIIDQQQELGRRQALHQAVEQGLGLGVDPVQVFTHQQQRLHLAFAQQHTLEGLEGVLAAL